MIQKFFRMLLVPVLIVISTLFGLVAVGGAFLQTERGSKLLVSQLETIASDPDGISLEIGMFQGNLFGAFELGALNLKDQSGSWLNVGKLNFSWEPTALLTGKALIKSVRIDHIGFERQPVFLQDTDAQNTQQGFSLPVEVVIEELIVDEIDIAESVYGRKASFGIDASLNASDDASIHSMVNVVALDGQGDSINADVTFKPLTKRLSVSAEINGPQDGMLTRFIGFQGFPAIKVSVVGDGPLDKWEGQVVAEIENYFQSDLILLSKGDASIEVEAFGGITPSSSIADSLPLIEARRLPFSALISLDRHLTQLQIRSSSLGNDAFEVAVDGQVSLETQEFDGAIAAEIKRTDLLNEVIHPLRVEHFETEVRAKGNKNNIQVESSSRLVNVFLPNEEAEKGPVLGKLTIKAVTRFETGASNSIPMNVDAQIMGLANVPTEFAEVLGESGSINLIGSYLPQDNKYVVDNFSIKSNHLMTKASGAFDISDGSGEGSAEIVLDDLQALSSVKGQASIFAEFDRLDAIGAGQGRLKIKVSDFDVGNADANVLIGSDVAMTTFFDFDRQQLSFRDISIPLPGANFSGEVVLPSSFEEVRGRLNGTINDLNRFSKLAGIPLKGEVVYSSDLSGPISDLGIHGKLEISNLAIQGKELGEVTTSFSVASITSSPISKMNGEFSDPKIGLKFSANMGLASNDEWFLEQVEIVQQNNVVTGSLAMPSQGGGVNGHFRGSFPDLKRLSGILDISASGSAQAEVSIFSDQGEQSLNFDLKGSALSIEQFELGIGKLEMKLASQGGGNEPAVDLTAQLSEVSQGNLKFDRVSVLVNGGLDVADFELDVTGNSQQLESLFAKGAFESDTDKLSVRLDRVDGWAAGQNIRLMKPLAGQLSGETVVVDPFAIAIGDGSAEGQVLWSPGKKEVLFTGNELPLSVVQTVGGIEVLGTMDAKADIAFTPNNNKAEIVLSSDNIIFPGAELPELPVLSTRLVAQLDGNKLLFNAGVDGVSETSMTASGALPVNLIQEPFEIRLAHRKPMELTLHAKSNIDRIWPLLGLDRHSLTGKLVANGEVSGTLENPIVSGFVQLDDGRYEEIQLGTIIEDISVQANVENNDRVVLAAKGTDGGNGVIALDGAVNIANPESPYVGLVLSMIDMNILRQDMVSVVTNADLSVSGSTSRLAVEGGIQTKTMEVNIGGTLAPNVVELPVKEVGFPEQSTKTKVEQIATNTSKILLDIAIDLPKRVFIRGRGLDSEWEGKLNVKGTSEVPVVEGYLSPVRGQFTFAGKEFKLTKGTVRLVGKEDVDPELSLSATYSGKNIDAIVSINGTAANPEISFSSTDGLPEDEVLSQVLFGKSAAKLTGLEALQLAQAIAEVSGNLGSGAGVLGMVRQSLGADVLTAGVNEETGNAEVTVGKYIEDNIYVGVAQGATAGSTKARVEIEVNENLSIESETDQSSNSSVGVFWKWDY